MEIWSLLFNKVLWLRDGEEDKEDQRFICETCVCFLLPHGSLLEKEAEISDGAKAHLLLPGTVEEAWITPDEGAEQLNVRGDVGVPEPTDFGLYISLGGAFHLLFDFLCRPCPQELSLSCLYLTRYDCRQQEDDSQGPQGTVALVTRKDDCNLRKCTRDWSPHIFLVMCLLEHWLPRAHLKVVCWSQRNQSLKSMWLSLVLISRCFLFLFTQDRIHALWTMFPQIPLWVSVDF